MPILAMRIEEVPKVLELEVTVRERVRGEQLVQGLRVAGGGGVVQRVRVEVVGLHRRVLARGGALGLDAQHRLRRPHPALLVLPDRVKCNFKNRIIAMRVPQNVVTKLSVKETTFVELV